MPCRDLIHRIELDSPTRIVDLGCGPGNSTLALAKRWPAAHVEGVGSSPEMLARARSIPSRVRWTEADVRSWAPSGSREVIFSNAALQWVPDHSVRIPRPFDYVAPGGVLVFQVPARAEPAPGWVHALATVRERPTWSGHWRDTESGSNVLPLLRYYELLAPNARRVEIWDTEYVHVRPGPSSILEWIRGTALLPVIAQLPTDDERALFLQELAHELERKYPPTSSGTVLFPFLRRFVIADR